MRSPAIRPGLADLLRPVGQARWGMAAGLAVALCLILLVPHAFGHAELGPAVALGFVLTAVPTLPQQLRAAFGIIAVRGLTVSTVAFVVGLTAGSPVAHSATIVAAAVFGVLVEKVGPTAGLAVVLIAVDTGAKVGTPLAAWWPYAVGALAVLAAWLAWWGSAQAAMGNRHISGEPQTDGHGVAWSHAVRVGVAVGAAVVIAGLLPQDLVGGHWLITSVLLTIQPQQAQTGVRMAQRLSGNAVGAVIAAVVLGTHPSAPVVVAITVVLFVLAMALRPVNYTWWAVSGPPVLLVISEYPELFPWYEGGVRLAMNLAGALIVLLVVFGAPWVAEHRAAYRRAQESDSLSKCRYRRAK